MEENLKALLEIEEHLSQQLKGVKAYQPLAESGEDAPLAAEEIYICGYRHYEGGKYPEAASCFS